MYAIISIILAMVRFCFVTLLLLLTAAAGRAQSYSSRVLADSLFIPWEMVYAPDEHIWFTQKNGYLCRLNPDNGQMDTVLSIPDNVVQGEGGMLGFALAFTLIEDIHVYLAYQYLDGDDYFLIVKRLVYHPLNQAVIREDTLIDRIPGSRNHNGCRLLLDDDLLYISTGDAEASERAQDLNSLNGKILRIHIDGSIPSDNPISGSPVWTWGHRNAQGLLLHNGMLYSSEHGPATDDEINRIVGGRNYGWPEVSGYCDLPGEQQFCTDSAVMEPLHIWTPTIAPSDMIFYEGGMFPEWTGHILLTTLKAQQLIKLSLNTAGDSILQAEPVPEIGFGRLRDICTAPDGRVFLSTSNSPSGGQGAFVDRIIELRREASGLTSPEAEPALRLYPNPATDRIKLEATADFAAGRASYRITDVTGRMLRSGQLTRSEIPVAELAPGLYYLQLDFPGKEEVRIGRFIKK